MERWERLREDTDKKLSALIWFAAGMFFGILLGAFLQWHGTREAAAQDIVTKDWDMILRLAGRLEDIVLLGSTFARPRRARPRKRKA